MDKLIDALLIPLYCCMSYAGAMIILCWLFVRRAPMGWEDESGFHCEDKVSCDGGNPGS
jgi:hypothetical protein